MKVFIVMHGEKCQGGSVKSVHKNESDAIKAALSVRTCFEGGWVEDGENEWENGCDFVSVQEWIVK